MLHVPFTYDHVIGGIAVAQYEGEAVLDGETWDHEEWFISGIVLDGLDASARLPVRRKVTLAADDQLARQIIAWLVSARRTEIENAWRSAEPCRPMLPMAA